VLASAFAAAAYCLIAWPIGALAGFALHIAWHVLDGADGDLARRTGRSSPTGEIVDGVCDYLSHIVLYSALAAVLSSQIGGWAWLLAAASGAARAVQANSYETRRRNYQYWIQGGSWLRQTLSVNQPSVCDRKVNPLMQRLGRAYLAVSEHVSAQDPKLDAALTLGLRGDAKTIAATRTLYRKHQAGGLRGSFLLSSNDRTVALFVSMLAGSPLYFFCYEIVGLSLLLGATLIQQRRRNAALVAALGQVSM